MEKSISLKISDKDYNVKFPTVGQILDIESLKSALTNGTYGDLVRMGTKTSNNALDLTDTIATFSILIKNLNKILNVDSYSDLDPFVGKELVMVYKNQFFPWFNEINKELQDYGT